MRTQTKVSVKQKVMAKKKVPVRQTSADSDSDAPEEASFSAGKAAAGEVRKALAEQKKRLRGERRAQHEKNTAQKAVKRRHTGSTVQPPQPQNVQIGDSAAIDASGTKERSKSEGRSCVYGRSILQVKVLSERRPPPPSLKLELQGRYSRRETVASFLGKQRKRAVRSVKTSFVM